MQGGDISNSVPPRLIFLFENLLGVLPDHFRIQETSFIKLKRWKRAVGCWELDSHMVKVLWDLTWRLDYRVDVLTYKPGPFGEELQDRLSDLPISNVFTSTPHEFSRRLAIMPDVAAVYDPDPNRMFTYGSKGRSVKGGVDFRWT